MSVQLTFFPKTVEEVEHDLVMKIGKNHRAMFALIGDLKKMVDSVSNENKQLKESVHRLEFKLQYPERQYDLVS